MQFEQICKSLKQAHITLATHTSAQKNAALVFVRDEISKSRHTILEANSIDVSNARANGMSESLVERLALSDKKIDSMIEGMNTVIASTDPIGQQVSGWKAPNGMTIRQERVPLGIVAIIYESRPNVTVDAFCLAYKSGNSILLRGSSSALNSNKAIVACIKAGLQKAGTDGIPSAVELFESTSHDDVQKILTAHGLIDVVLPRGGLKLIQTVVENSRIPVIETGSGVCHIYVDESADIEMATRIAYNAKTQRPGACNAVETIIVHKSIAQQFLSTLLQTFTDEVELRADSVSYQILTAQAKTLFASDAQHLASVTSKIMLAHESDFGYEFLDFICAIKVVANIDEAVDFINTHGTKHSECIITNDRTAARKFQKLVDAACVYVNTSTRFTDGGEFGFGMELGISTQKLHARGPMGLAALTTTKFFIDGDGQVRP